MGSARTDDGILDGAPASGRAATTRWTGDGAHPDGPLRRFSLDDASDPPPVAVPRRHVPIAIAAGALAMVGLLLLRGPLRGVLPFVLLLVAATALVRRHRLRGAAAAQRRPRRGREVLLHRSSVALSRGGYATTTTGAPRDPVEETLIDLDGGFGWTLFSSRSRDRVVLAVTSRAGTLFVAAPFGGTERRAHAGFLARASVVDGDETLDAVGPDGRALELRAGDLVELVDALGSLDASAADRILLSDGRGQPLVLDGASLRVGEHRFDLMAPIEWRAFLFQEPFGGAVTVYQATWIRQGPSAVVLVALVPSILGHPTPPESSGIPELDRALVRDLRLSHASAGDPPPQDQRVAVDRLFVLPMRAALDGAPRASSHGSTTGLSFLGG